MANSLSLNNGIWSLSSSSRPPIGFMSGFFGNGSDGDLIVSGTYTITRETFFNNLTVQAGGEVKPNGFRIYVENVLTINASGSINDDGNSSTGSVGGVGLGRRNYLFTQQGQGGNGGANGAGSNGNTLTLGLGCYNNSGVAPNGGAGGRPAPATGTPGTASPMNSPTIGMQIWGSWAMGLSYTDAAINNTNRAAWIAGGAGGGGASSGVGAVGGGGGAGGGMVWLAASTIINNGRISVNGGDSGPATGSPNAGSGGSGGGGIMIVITNTPSSSLGIIQSNAGSVSTTVTGTGTTGSVGNSGPICIISFGGN
jgi:hypothetical protein